MAGKMIYWSEDRRMAEREFKRLGFDKDARWRISDINKDFQLCNTYPRFIIVPASFQDKDLESVAKYRYFKRVPTAVWRHIKNGCFIVRSSQPTVGWFGWFRSELDESLIQSYVSNTVPVNSEQNNIDIDDDDSGKKLITTSNNDDCLDNNDDLCDQQTLVDESEHDSQNINVDDRNDKVTTHKHTTNGLSSSPTQQRHLNHNQATTNNHSSNGKDLTNSDGSSDERDSNNKTPNNDLSLRDNITSGETPSTTTTISSSSFPPAATATITNANATNTSSVASTNSNNKNTSIALSSSSSSPTTNQLSLNNSTTNGNGISTFIENLSSPADADNSISATPPSKMLIIDARSYTAAMANRAKGGGCECSEYYQRCEVQFMNLANIHSIRKSFHAIRSVCEAYSEQSNNWLSFLDNSRWLHHISGLLKSALLIVDTIDIEEKSILIHCSDGWDRTPQLVALAEIMLDPHYRTFDGFRTLIQREWLDFGHKFADRCGSNPCNEDPNERCPVFLQWLDCVQQLLVQYPNHFEFNSSYLDKLNRHTYSNIFGTFSYNSTQERILARVDEKVLSLWSYFDSARSRFRNENYVESNDILRPATRNLYFWKEIYLKFL